VTSGRWLVLGIIGVTAVFAAAQWWFQTRAYYAPIESADLFVTTLTGEVLTLTPETFEGIDADTSPLRFRVCFTLDEAGLAAAGQGAPSRSPRPSPRRAGSTASTPPPSARRWRPARPRPSSRERNARAGVDRVFAVFPDGRVYGWHQLNGTLE
jgi:hypothetical protein